MDQAYDVIIIGAGPAGSTAAFFLGEAGKRVLVLDKEIFPRYKPCGGGLSSQLLKRFPFSFETVIESRVKSVSYAVKENLMTVRVPEGDMLMVMREQFDAYILQQAKAGVKQGSYVRAVEESEDSVVVETRNGERYEAKYLIGADGANSLVARHVGLRRGKTMAAAIEAEVSVSPAVMERFRDAPLFIFGEVRLGYLWIFPKANHLSVGIGALRPKRGELQATLQRVMARYGVSIDGLKLHGHPIPIYLRKETIATQRTLLVGDAAGLADPFTGEGIRFAIKSGRWAAEAILAKQPDQYQKTVRRKIGLSHMLGMGLALFFYRFPRAGFHLGIKNPFATRAFLDLFSDQASYGEVIFRIFGTFPIYMITELLSELAIRVGWQGLSQKLKNQVYPIQPC